MSDTSPEGLYQQYALYLWEGNGNKAISCCKKAAGLGIVPAQYDLALHYLYGNHVKKDVLFGITLMEEAASLGYKEAARRLISLYSAGTIVRYNPGRADYPGSELLGEGIFIEFPKDRLIEWKNSMANRYEKMHARYDDKKYGPLYGTFSTITVLLHTISHMIIKELEYTCGYDSSSLAERIYVSETESEWMSGVLIYTSSPSSDGSLGGLAREANTDRFEKTITGMLEKAKWCSNDPICAESEEHGANSLSYAACHACIFIGETSCSMNNILLDRCAVIGKSINGDVKGYFN